MRVPKEADSQKAVMDYCKVRGWPFWNTDQSAHIPFVGTRMKRKRAGVRPGLPDLVVFVTLGGKCEMAFVEMKRELGPHGGMNGSKIGNEQAQFADLCENAGILHRFCHGAQDAITFLEAIKETL
jgi:hypothetical protein